MNEELHKHKKTADNTVGMIRDDDSLMEATLLDGEEVDWKKLLKLHEKFFETIIDKQMNKVEFLSFVLTLIELTLQQANFEEVYQNMTDRLVDKYLQAISDTPAMAQLREGGAEEFTDFSLFLHSKLINGMSEALRGQLAQFYVTLFPEENKESTDEQNESEGN